MPDIAPFTEEQSAAARAACPFHIITDGHPTEEQLATKTGEDVSDAQIDAWVKGLTPFDFFQLYSRTCLEANKPQFFRRYWRLVWAWRKKN